MEENRILKDFMREGIPRIRKSGKSTRQQFIDTTYGKAERRVSEKLQSIGLGFTTQIVQKVFSLLNDEKTNVVIGHTLCIACENIVRDKQKRVIFLVPAKIKREYVRSRGEFVNFRAPLEGSSPYATLCGEGIGRDYYDSMYPELYDNALVKPVTPGTQTCPDFSPKR